MSDEILMDIRKDYVLSRLREGERIDGRKLDEVRKIQIETNIISKAEGSALVKLGDTQVMVGIKMQVGEPFPDTPDKGIIITNAELVPLASPTFEAGPPDETSIELARIVDRGIRESEAVDLHKLCIEEGEKVWIVFIDIHALDDDGNLVDASALAAISALLNTTVPAERFEVGDDFPLPVRDLPVAVTSLVVGDKYLVDPNRDEMSVGNKLLTITTDKDDNIVAIQKSGSYLLDEEKFYELIDVSVRKAREIRELLKEV
ncbi:ribosomal RNA-processing protein RRP42 [Archaeoglobus sulfaticallidus PM70-1]|uniref:Exosome complex component Rrp42 n=1 Tax=Archaeoglobus sulfaticallidus PM70-1 TaxID=387631 RepID=N0BIN3_9EURY|nr:exosome complex protein Rrp42 [Archaeoglobus sulfaticallidus]AGK62182.1 ribosomal RNA-processing protein RRP42 [Archaeoglobus sulfaticallidus PM70-1]